MCVCAFVRVCACAGVCLSVHVHGSEVCACAEDGWEKAKGEKI